MQHICRSRGRAPAWCSPTIIATDSPAQSVHVNLIDAPALCSKFCWFRNAASTWTAVVSFVKFVSCTSRVRRLNSYGSAFFPLFFVSFRHSERWLAMLKSWTCMALNFHHTLGYQPVQQALARFRFRTQNSRYSHSVSLLQAQFDRDQKMHSWSWTKLLPLRIKPFRQERIYHK